MNLIKIFFYISSFMFGFGGLTYADPCSKDSVATINISLDFSKSSIPDRNGNWFQHQNKLPSVDSDRQIMKKLSKDFFNAKESFEFTDTDAVQQESAVGTQRDLFLEKIKTFSDDFHRRNGANSKIYINISTHGVRCRDSHGNIKWGFLIPEKKFDVVSAAPDVKDPEYLFKCEDHSFQKLFVSAEDLVANTDSSGFIVDTCYAGHLEKNLVEVKSKILNKKGFFILTSSLDFLPSLERDSTQGGGALFQALDQLLATPEICSLDINGDGEISQEEVAFYALGFYLKGAEDKVPVEKLLKKMNVLPKKKQSWMDATSNLGSAKVSNTCMMKIPARFKCPILKKSPKSFLGMCSDQQSELEVIHNKLFNLYRSIQTSKLFRYSDVKVGSTAKLSTQASSQEKKSLSYAMDSRRLVATRFFDNYLRRLQTDYMSACRPVDYEQCLSKFIELDILRLEMNKILLLYQVHDKDSIQ